MWNDLKRYSMSSFSSSFKRILIFILAAGVLISGCGPAAKTEPQVTVGDLSGFYSQSAEESRQLDELYLYINEHSEVSYLPDADVQKMADNIEAFYTKLVEDRLLDYRERGNEASFEEMLYFLFHLDTKEALRFYSEGYAKAEVKNRMVIHALAKQYDVTVSDREYELLRAELEVSTFLTGDADGEVRYELLRRKVLKTILEKLNK